MNKVLAKNGVLHNMETLFSDLQSYTKGSLSQILLGLVETYGVMAVLGQDGEVFSGDTSLKVTYTTPGAVNVAAGFAITSDLGFVSAASTSVPMSYPLVSGLHTLYVRYKLVDSTPKTILNGFNYVPGETVTATRQYDSFDYVWDVATSGIVVADITYGSTGVVSLIHDRRNENIFTLRTDVLPNVLMRTDWVNKQSLMSRLAVRDSTEVVASSGTNVIIITTTGPEVGQVTVDADTLKNAATRQHVQNTDTGTTAATFKVGVGSLGPGAVGLNVLTEPATPSNVKNFRIVDISGGNNEVFYGLASRGKLKQGLTKKKSNNGQVTVAWGYDGIVGTGSTVGLFTIDHTQNVYSKGVDGGVTYANATFSSNELVGLYFYIPVQGASYIITANTATAANATVLTLSTIAGTTGTNLTGVNTTTTARGSIHNGCDTYNVRMVPVMAASTSTEVLPAQQSSAVTKDGTLGVHAALHTTFSVPLGWLVNFYITAANANLVNSNEVTMLAGSYVKPTNASKYTLQVSPGYISYTVPVPLELPVVVTGLSRITAVSTPHGFALSLTVDSVSGGWDLADEYEYVYTTDNAGADFANPVHERYVTSERWLDIPTSGTRSYNIKVRPLLCGQSIGDTLSTRATSGAGGQSPTDVTITQFPVNLKTFAGTMSWSAGAESWLMSSLNSPANTLIATSSQNSIPSGSILVDKAAVVTTSVLVPKSGTYTVSLVLTSTVNLPTGTGVGGSGTAYIIRETAGSLNAIPIRYATKNVDNRTLEGVSLYWPYGTSATGTQVFVGELVMPTSYIYEYLVEEVGANYINLTALGGAPTPTAGTFIVNVTKRGRMLLYKTGLTFDVNVTRGFMDCDILKGEKARVRWFQNELETSNDSLSVTALDTPFYQDSDVTIYAENQINGIRTLIVDAFDDTATMCNSSNLVGTFTLYGRARSIADKNFESQFVKAIADNLVA